MAPDTSFLGMSFPEENQDPYYEVISSFYGELDQNIYTNFAQSQLLTGGGKLGITIVDANTKRFTWTEDFAFPILATGKMLYLRYNRGTTDRHIDLIDGDRVVFDIYLTSAEDVVADVYKINGGLTQSVAPIPKVFTLGVMTNGEFYTQLKNYLGQEVSIDGALGIGTQGDSDPAAKLHVFTESSASEDPTALKGILADARPSVSASGTYNTTVIFAGNREPEEPTMVIPSGVTNSGYFHGIRSEAIRTNTVDQGSLSSLASFSGYYGHETSLNTNATTANAYGILLTPYHQKGTISNSYGIYLADALVGGTATNPYGIYQANTFKNALFGPVGIGKVPGLGTTSGFTTQTFSLDVANSNDLIFRGKGTTSTRSAQLHFFNNLDKGLRVTAYGSSYSGTSEFSLGSNGVSMVTDSAGPFAIGTFGVAQPLILATNSTERLRIDSSGNLGLGITTTAQGRLHVARSGGTTLQFIDSHHTAPQSGLVGRTSRGTQTAPTATQSGDNLLFIGGRGYGTSSFASESRAGIEIYATENWTNSAQGAGIEFFTTANGGTTTSNKMWLSADGSLGIGTDSPSQALELSKAVDGTALRITSTQNDSAHSTVDPFTSVEFYSNDASGPGASVRARVGAQFVDASGAGTALTFSTSTSAGLAEAMRIDNFGYVGIGDTGPLNALSIRGNSTAKASIRITHTGYRAAQIRVNTSNQLVFGLDGTDGGTGRLFINPDGTVGIAEPGSTAFSTFNILKPQLYAADADLGIAIGTTTAASVDIGKAYAWRQRVTGGPLGQNFVLENIVRDGDWSEKLRVDSAGRIGVGTTAPQYLLEIASSDVADGNHFAVRAVRNSDGAANLNLRKARGTSVESPEFVQAGDYVGAIRFQPYGRNSGNTENAWREVATVFGRVESVDANSRVSGQLIFATATETSASLERMRIDSAGRVIIGGGATLATPVASTTAADLQVTKTIARVTFNGYEESTGVGALLSFGKARGTAAAPAAIQANDNIGTIRFAGHDGTDMVSYAAAITANAEGTISQGVMPGRLVFSTTSAAGNNLERMRIDSSGNVIINRVAGNALTPTALTIDGTTGQTLTFSATSDTLQTIGAVSFNIAGSEGARIEAERTGAAGRQSELKFFTRSSGGSTAERVRIDSNGRLLVGATQPYSAAGINSLAQLNAIDGTAALSAIRWSANTSSSYLVLGKSRGATVGTHSAVLSGDELGRVIFSGSDGAVIQSSSFISGHIDGSTGINNLPGRLSFWTAPSGSITGVERLRITSSGTIQFAGALSDGTNSFENSDLFSLRNVRFRDSAKTQAVQGGDRVVYDSASSTWLATAGMAVATVSANTTLTNSNEVILVNASGGARTITLPAASVGKSFTIKKTDSSANLVTVAAAGSSRIDGEVSVGIPAQYDAIQVVSDGTNWFLI